MSESKNSGTAVPFFILFVFLAAMIGYGMANQKPAQHADDAHHETSHEETGDHSDDSHSDDGHSSAPAMDISHAPGEVYDSAGHLEGTTSAPIEPTTSNESSAPRPGFEAHVNSEMDAPATGTTPPPTSAETSSQTASESN